MTTTIDATLPEEVIMSENASRLRLVDLTGHRDSYPLERRGAHRRRLSGTVTAIVITREGGSTTLGQIAPIQLMDISESGIGGISAGHLPEDAVVRLHFPPMNHEPGFEAIGRIARCRQTANGWSIGVAFIKQSVAA
ncbi:MAG: PilZ domain-containing protein [Phycisphaeraceae bacterium]|nr:PilZ domain-containing protein [Phycisphaeraceae bacterium]